MSERNKIPVNMILIYYFITGTESVVRSMMLFRILSNI